VNKSFGTYYHRAPEICRLQFPYDGEKADVFALGIVLYAMQMISLPVDEVKYATESDRY
jgi:serine/threonine protein kinase